MSDVFDDYESLDLDKGELQLLDQPIDRPLSRGDLTFGSDAYCVDYKEQLARKAAETIQLDPFYWQINTALAAHLGRDVCLIAGTGFGKTLAFILRCLIEKNLLVWLISPLNALANQQAKTFRKWGISAIAVNATTNYPGLFKDILSGKFQVVISSIEAFTDTTRLLPAVKSPELASRGPQMVVVDEAHCMAKWGPSFRPQYSVVGELKLILTQKTPFIATTATANNLTREAIKQSLRFGSDSLTINLGNFRPNLAYSVHRLKRAAASIPEILEYFPSRTEFPEFTLIFVDSRPIGQDVLHLLRQHVTPDIRWMVQIYHAFRSDFIKEVLATGFEREDGFQVMICTEALTMGVDFRKVSRVIQVLAPTDIETLIQRGGRGGRDPSTISEVILMAQDSLFEDSKAGQKRLEKIMKKEDVPATTQKVNKRGVKATRTIAKKATPARSSPKEFSEGMFRFINADGCLVETLDKECDNPPRPDDWKKTCLCEHHRLSRGEPTYQERMKEHLLALEGAPVVGIDTGCQGQDEAQENEDASEEEEQEQVGDDKSDPDSEVDVVDGPPAPKSKWRSSRDRKPYVAAMMEWRDRMDSSPECLDWNVTKEWILSKNTIAKIARTRGIDSVQVLANVRPTWIHLDRWGEDLVQHLVRISVDQERQAEDKRQAKEARLNRARQAEQERLAEQERRAISMQRAAEAQSNTQEPTAKRPRLSKNATEEERIKRKEEQAEDKWRKAREKYWARKAEKATKVEETEAAEATPQAGPSGSVAASTSYSQPIVTFSMKEEAVDELDGLLESNDPSVAPGHPSTQLYPPQTLPMTPFTPSNTRNFQFHVSTAEDVRVSLQQSTPVSRPKGKARAQVPLPETEVFDSPSTAPKV